MRLTSSRAVIWTVPPEDGAQEVDEYRFTFVSGTMASSGRYWQLMRDFEEWHKETFGLSNEEARGSDEAIKSQEAWRSWTQANDHAAIIASLRSIDQRCREVEGDGKEPPWNTLEMPPDWLTFKGFYEAVPFVLAIALADAAHAMNPGLWRPQSSEEAKKKGGASAS